MSRPRSKLYSVVMITYIFPLSCQRKHHKQDILTLDQEDGVIVGDTDLKKYIINYYKTLFSQLDDIQTTMAEPQVSDIPQATELENEQLTAYFTDIKGSSFPNRA